MCTVLLRFEPGAGWPVLLGAVRDEFVDRPSDPPGEYWPDRPGVLGGRDRHAGGTWLAVDPARPALAAVLNGPPLAAPPDELRPTRGILPLAALAPRWNPPTATALAHHDTFHLLLATPAEATVWSWDGVELAVTVLRPGDHILVNTGVDDGDDPLVPHFGPLLAATATVRPAPGGPTALAWGPWFALMRGDGLHPRDPRALLVDHTQDGRRYASTSVALVGLADQRGRRGLVRYDYCDRPFDADGWREIRTGTLPPPVSPPLPGSSGRIPG